MTDAWRTHTGQTMGYVVLTLDEDDDTWDLYERLFTDRDKAVGSLRDLSRIGAFCKLAKVTIVPSDPDHE